MRGIALLAALVGFVIALWAALNYDSASGFQEVQRVPWIPSLGIQYFLGADGISLVLVLLTGIAAFVVILV